MKHKGPGVALVSLAFLCLNLWRDDVARVGPDGQGEGSLRRPLINFAPLYVAIDRGFMKEQNIDVEMQKVASREQRPWRFWPRERSMPEELESRQPPSMPSIRDSISALLPRQPCNLRKAWPDDHHRP